MSSAHDSFLYMPVSIHMVFSFLKISRYFTITMLYISRDVICFERIDSVLSALILYIPGI